MTFELASKQKAVPIFSKWMLCWNELFLPLLSILFLKIRTPRPLNKTSSSSFSVSPQNPNIKRADQDLCGDDQKANISKTASE